MTAPRIVDPGTVLGQALSDASPDLMRHLLGTVINSLLSAEADAVCGAEWGQPSPERTNQRNGYRHRDLDTRVGTLDVAIPKLRAGSYFPEFHAMALKMIAAQGGIFGWTASSAEILAGLSTTGSAPAEPAPSTTLA